ncbi:MAG: hypothetical protein V3R64_05180 [Sphingomonadales bacterium]
MTRKKDNKGRFKAEYDWKILIPAILEEYVEKETALFKICLRPDYPSYWQVWNVIKSNPEYKKEWGLANMSRLKMLESEYVEICDMCDEAFHDKSKSLLPIKLKLQIWILRANNFERVAARNGYL